MKAYLATFPTDKALSAGALALTAFVVVNWTVACSWFGRAAPDGLEPMLVFLGAWLGIDTGRRAVAGRTQIVTPPQVMAADAATPAAVAVTAAATPEPTP